jgi:rod shape determining protein RodA
MGKSWSGFDLIISSCLLILVVLGLLVIFPLSSELARFQLLFAMIGFLLMLVVTSINYQFFKAFGVYIYLISLLILGALYFLGEEVRGSIRWFTLGRFQLQPSEFLKPLLILSYAKFLDETKHSSLKSFVRVVFLVGLPISLIFFQPDLGNTAIYFLVALTMAIITGVPLSFVLASLIMMTALIPTIWFILKDYQKQRVLSFLNPNLDPLGSGYHIIQSLTAIGSGYLLGKGIGRGTQSRLRFLPEQHNDFIFATLAEEIGWVGVNIVLVAFFLCLWRMLKIAEQTEDRFGALVVSGVAAQLLIQMFINCGMNMGILPITGVTFPFLSYGGSSLISGMIGVGLVQSVAVHRNQLDNA